MMGLGFRMELCLCGVVGSFEDFCLMSLCHCEREVMW